MSIAAFWKEPEAATVARHPNELDLRRIIRAVAQRDRYRYVRPSVLPADHGYLIRSECCSRNIDPDGGVIDVALLRWSEEESCWTLHRKDHAAADWVPDSQFSRLPELFDRLNRDVDRIFWQ